MTEDDNELRREGYAVRENVAFPWNVGDTENRIDNKDGDTEDRADGTVAVANTRKTGAVASGLMVHFVLVAHRLVDTVDYNSD